MPRRAGGPLAGRTIVVTRARPQAAAFSALLRRSGARVIEAPAIAFRPPRSWKAIDRALERIATVDLLILTSVNGVERFLSRARARGIGLPALRRPRVVAIGPATAKALRERGFRAVAVPEEFRAEGIVARLAGRGLRGVSVLVPRAAVARDHLATALGRRGARVTVAPVYRTVPARAGRNAVVRAVRAGRIDLLTFASSSTVEHFLAGFGAADRRRLARVPAAVIGPITAATARRRGLVVAVAPRRYTIPALAAAIARHFRAAPARRFTRRAVVD